MIRLATISDKTWERNTNVIKKSNIVDIGSSTSITSTTTKSYTGVSITIPAGSFYSISVNAVYNNSNTVWVGICLDNIQASSAIADGGTAYVCANACTSGYVATDTTFYIWAQYLYATQNTIAVRGFYIN